jgi:hypothetical protein
MSHSLGWDPIENTVSIVIAQQYLDCCLFLRCLATNVYSDSAIPAFRRHVTIRMLTSMYHTLNKITDFWNVTPYSLLDRYQHFGRTHCLYLQGTRREWGQQFTPNRSTYRFHIEPSRFLLDAVREVGSVQPCFISSRGTLGPTGDLPPVFDEMEECNETHKHTCPRLVSKPQLLKPPLPILLH